MEEQPQPWSQASAPSKGMLLSYPSPGSRCGHKLLISNMGMSQGTTYQQQQQAGISHSREVFMQDGEGFSSRAPRDQGIINSPRPLAAAAQERPGDAAGLAASQECSQDTQITSCSWQPRPAAWPLHPAWPLPPIRDEQRAWECTPGMGGALEVAELGVP